MFIYNNKYLHILINGNYHNNNINFKVTIQNINYNILCFYHPPLSINMYNSIYITCKYLQIQTAAVVYCSSQSDLMLSLATVGMV